MSVFSSTSLFAVALGGAVGSVARYLLSVGLSSMSNGFPWNTLLINSLGCFAIGTLATLTGEWRNFWVMGLLGGFTTFSAFGLETWQLLQEGRLGAAGAYALSSVMTGLLAVTGGVALAKLLGSDS